MSVLRKALLVNSTEFVCIALGLAQNIILTRTLGPEGIGQYTVVISALSLAALVCCFGVPMSFLYHSRRDPDHAKRYLVSALWVLTALGLVGGALLVVLIVTQQGYFGVLPRYALIMIFLYMPVSLWQVLARNSLLIEIHARKLSIMRLLRDVVCTVLVLLLLAAGLLKVPQATTCFIISCLVPMVLGWRWIWDLVDFSMRPRAEDCRKLVSMGIRLNWADLMVVLNAQVSIFVIRYLLGGFDQVGYFSRGLRISMLVVTATETVLPLLFSRWAGFPEEHLARHVEKVMRFVSSVSLATIVFIILAGKWIILIMYGAEFLPAVKPMMILVPGTLLYLLSRTFIQLLHSRGLPELSAIMLSVAALTNAVLSWLLVPTMGIIGAALANTCGNIVLLLLLVITVRLRYDIRVSQCLILTRKDVLSIIAQLKSREPQDVE
jgi:O-antigen/teichoic acid export membrane protein